MLANIKPWEIFECLFYYSVIFNIDLMLLKQLLTEKKRKKVRLSNTA